MRRDGCGLTFVKDAMLDADWTMDDGWHQIQVITNEPFFTFLTFPEFFFERTISVNNFTSLINHLQLLLLLHLHLPS